MRVMRRTFGSFAEFYPYYLSEHSHPTCRRLHVVGTGCVLALALVAALTANPWWLAGLPIVGYGFAWIGHLFFEHNQPATFAYPLYSLVADFAMFRDVVLGRLPF